MQRLPLTWRKASASTLGMTSRRLGRRSISLRPNSLFQPLRFNSATQGPDFVLITNWDSRGYERPNLRLTLVR